MTNIQKKSLLILRLLFGILFFWSGVDKILSGFTATGYLNNAVSGPFVYTFNAMAGSPFVDFLVIYGETAIGLALITGAFIRFASLMGILMMLLFYLSVFPPAHGLISEHIIYILVFMILSLFGVGKITGIDRFVEEQEFVKKHYKIFRYLLG